MTEPCPPIPELDTDSWDELSKAYIELAFLYGGCAARHSAILQSYYDSTNDTGATY